MSIRLFVASILIDPVDPGVETLVYSVKEVPVPLYVNALSVGICQYTSPATAGDFTPSITVFFVLSAAGSVPVV